MEGQREGRESDQLQGRPKTKGTTGDAEILGEGTKITNLGEGLKFKFGQLILTKIIIKLLPPAPDVIFSQRSTRPPNWI